MNERDKWWCGMVIALMMGLYIGLLQYVLPLCHGVGHHPVHLAAGRCAQRIRLALCGASGLLRLGNYPAGGVLGIRKGGDHRFAAPLVF